MKKLLTLALLLCSTLLSAQNKSITEWQEIDTLIAQGHYTSAYEKGEELLHKAKRKGDSHAMLRIAYLQHKAEAGYQENVTEKALARYRGIVPGLSTTDRAIAHMLIANIYRNYYNGNRYRIVRNATATQPSADYTTWSRETFIDTIGHYYALALQEREALLRCPVEQCDILTDGNEQGRLLRPTLYDVIVQEIIETPENVEADEESVSILANDSLYGDDVCFAQMHLPQSKQPYIRQLRLLQSLTRAHQTYDIALRASLDLLRMEYVKRASQLYNPDLYIKHIETFAEEYRKSPAWCAEFLYRLASHYVPNAWGEQSAENKAKAIAYCQEAIRIAPKSNGGKMCKNLYDDIVRPTIGLASNEIVLPEEGSVVRISYKNTPKLYFRIVRGSMDEDRYSIRFTELTGRRVVRKWEVQTDCPDAYTTHMVLADLPALGAGTYWLLVSNEPDFSDKSYTSYVRFDCTGLMLHMARDISRREVSGVVVNAKSGAAVHDCEISLMKKVKDTYTLIEHFYPDKKGGFVIPMNGHTGNLMVRVTDGTSTTYRTWYANPHERDTDDSETRCTIHTDRYTYRPGDTIRWNIVACRVGYHEQRVIPDTEVTVTLKDRNFKTADTATGTTDEFGCMSGWFALPTDVTPGNFRFEVSLGKKMVNFFHQSVNVEAFKAPSFEIALHTPKATLHLGDSVVVQGEATTYTGLPVDKATVGYKVARTQRERYQTTQSIVATGRIVSDEKGGFSIPFVAQHFGKADKHTVCHYTITVDVTDRSGETHSQSTSVAIGMRTATLTTEVPNIMQPGDKLAYATMNLNGQNIAKEVQLRIAKLSVPETSRLHSNLISRYPDAKPLTKVSDFLNEHPTVGPNEMFDKSQWTEEKVCVETTLMTSDQGESTYMPELTEDGVYKVEFTYHDGNGKTKETAYFTRLNKESTQIPGLELLMAYSPEQTVTAGSNMPLYIGTHYEDVHVYYIVQQGYQIIDRGELTLSNQLKPITIHAPKGQTDNIAVYGVTIKEGIVDLFVSTFAVAPQTYKLDIAVSTFRNYLEPGETEQCTLTIKDYTGEAVQATATVAVFDAALDVYGTSEWSIPTKGSRYMWQYLSEFYNHTTSQIHIPRKEECTLDMPQYYSLPEGLREDQIFYSLAAPATARGQAKNRIGVDMASAEGLVLEESAVSSEASKISEDSETSEPKTQDPYLRKDLRHTALFLPDLRTDEQGQVTFTVTAPDLLTQWHVKGIAHTKDLKHGRVNFDFVTRKTLMVQPHVPRFLYEGDQCEFTAKVTNSGDEPIEAVVRLETGGREQSQAVFIDPNSSTSVSFPIIAPTGENYLTYRITAESLRYSDGEQATITILPRRMLVTETMALYVNGKEKREFVFDALKEKHSPTLEHKSLTLELVPNPIWYAIEALPPLCKEENPSNERLFHRYYAATMGAYLIDRYPEVEGYREFYRRDSLATLCQSLLSHLATNQDTDGGWAWMNGFDSDRYTTLLIIKGLGELEAMHCLNIAQNDTLYTMVKHGIHFLDANYYDSFSRMKRKPKTLDSYALYYLYARSMFPEIPFGNTPSTAYEHYKALLMKDKATQGTLMQKALKMLTLIRLNEHDKAVAIAEVVRQSSLKSDEMGIYWRDNRYGWSWDSNPIATQALLIEAFKRLDQPADIIGRMQQWLLKQKQTTQWSNSIATAQAIHALMGASSREEQTSLFAKDVDVKVKNATLRLIEQDKRGTVKYEVTPEKRVSAMPEIPILLEGKETPSMAWGSMTWQYYEDANKVKASGTGLTLKCTYYKVENHDGKDILIELSDGLTSLAKGDRIRVRLQFTADRAMDYVELHLQRPAALEPVSTRSGYTFTNGLGYYSSVENSATKLYFYRIDKGSYFVDSDFWVSHAGHFSSGLSTIQCMYAPEFIATESSKKITVSEL